MSNEDDDQANSMKWLAILNDRINQEATAPFGYPLHYDVEINNLRPWYWPSGVYDERVHPANFFNHRSIHDFRGPCCFCVADPSIQGEYTETAVFKKASGMYSGEYVAACVRNDCGYIVPLGRMYNRPNLPTCKYPIRAMTQGQPADPTESSVEEPLKSIARLRKKRSVTDQILALDEGGVPEHELKVILKKCNCGLVMTTRKFDSHNCEGVRRKRASSTVIDLTANG